VSHPYLTSLSALLLLVDCGGTLPHPPFAPQVTSALTPIDLPPPPGRIERIPDDPPQANAWIDGEWIARHGRWYWLLGRWVKTPPGARYSPWVVVRSTDGRAFIAPGVWKDAKGATIQPPPPLAIAIANGSAVYDAAGTVDATGRSIKVAPTQRNQPQTPQDREPESLERSVQTTDATPGAN
jgi:hypothetical protein